MKRRKATKATRARRPAGKKPAPRKAASSASAALAKARARIGELEVEIRRLREELALSRGETVGGRSPDEDDGPLAPGM
jgi:hypothetical protein